MFFSKIFDGFSRKASQLKLSYLLLNPNTISAGTLLAVAADSVLRFLFRSKPAFSRSRFRTA